MDIEPTRGLSSSDIANMNATSANNLVHTQCLCSRNGYSLSPSILPKLRGSN